MNIEFDLPTETVSLKDKTRLPLRVLLTQTGTKTQERIVSHEAVIQVIDASSDELLARIPVLAIGLRTSEVEVGSLRSNLVELRNQGSYIGEAWAYNLLARGERHPTPVRDLDSISIACNLMSAGYRINRDGMIDFGFQIDRPVTRWEACTAIILFSVKGGEGTNSEADLELVGASTYSMPNIEGIALPGEHSTLLFDAALTREMRGEYEQVILDGGNAAAPNYAEAVIDVRPMIVREHGRVTNLSISHQALMDALKERGMEGSEVHYRIGILNNTNAAYEYSSFLFEGWQKLDLNPGAQGFVDLPKQTRVINTTPTRVMLKTGRSGGELLMLFPDNL